MKILVLATSTNLGPGFGCLGLSLKFLNEVVVEEAKITSISINGEGSENVFLKKNNASVRIFNEIYGNLGGKKENFRFTSQNNIPLSRGLGSSSAVTVGAVGAAYAISGFKIEKERVLNEALRYENRPDSTAPATLGGLACSIVEDGEAFSVKKELDEALRATIVIPNIVMNTEQSREALSLNVSLKDCVLNLSHSSFLTACFLEKKYKLLHLVSQGKLHELKRMKTLPELFETQKFALENKALVSTLSDSGSSFFFLAFKEEAKHLATKMVQKFPTSRVERVELDSEGFKIC